MIPFLNHLGEIWFNFIKLIVIQNTFFLGIVFRALYLLRNASAQVKYTITLIGLIKLILPPFIPSPFIKSSSNGVSVTGGSNPIEHLVVVYQSIRKELFLSNTAILFSIWFILTGFVFSLFILSTFRLKFKLRNSLFLQTLDSDVGNKKYKIYQSKFISMPLTVGLFPQKIFVPESWKKWPHECKKMILNHELAKYY